MVELGAHTVKGRSDMFAQISPVRAGTIQVNFLRRWKQALFGAGHDLHDSGGKFALEQFDQGINLAGALGLDGLPKTRRQGFDLDFDPVKLRAGNQRGHVAFADLQINHRTVAHIGASAGEPIGIVAVGLEVVAPGLAPKGAGNLAPIQHDGRSCPAGLLGQFCSFARCFSPPFRDRHVRTPSV